MATPREYPSPVSMHTLLITVLASTTQDNGEDEPTVMVFIDLKQGMHVDAITQALFAEVASSSNDIASTSVSLLDTSNQDNIWTRLYTLATNFVDGILRVTGLKTDTLCIGETCVNEATLIRVLELIDGEEIETGEPIVNDGDGGGDADVGTITVDIETPSPEPTPEPIPEPAPEPEPDSESESEVPVVEEQVIPEVEAGPIDEPEPVPVEEPLP